MVSASIVPKHAAYRQSGIPWLGEIPEHWRVERGKWQHKFKKQLNRRGACDNVLSLTLRGVVNNNPDDPEGLVPKDYDTYQIFEKDDLVFKLIDLENFKTSRVGLVHERGVMSPAYIRVTPSESGVPRFHFYLYYSLYQQGVYNMIGAGVRSTLNPTDLLEIPTLHPPCDEQERIANFLDQKNVEINESIAKKQRLIELLKEQKTILINQAVTKGLNPDAPMRDSGVNWIGKVPERWDVKKIKHLVTFISGGTPSKNNIDYWGGDIPWVSPKDMKTRYLSRAIDGITEKAVKRTAIKLLDPGCVLIVVRGMILAKKVPVAISTVPLTINQDMKAMIPSAGCLPEYLLFLLDGLHEELSTLLEESGHGTKTLPTDKLGNFSILLPPPEEQAEIISHIKNLDSHFDHTVSLVQEQIQHLDEMKRVIISEAVTGKIKL